MKNPFAGGTTKIEAYVPGSALELKQNLFSGQVDGIDDTTKQFLSRQVQQATRPDDEYMNDLMAGVGEQPKGLIATPEPTALPGEAVPDQVKEAFARRSQREGAEGLGRLKRQSGLEIEGRRASDLQRAVGNQLSKNSLRIQNQAARRELESQLQEINFLEEQARASILGSILGIVGTIAGTAIGGGFGGMAVSTGGAAVKKAATPTSVSSNTMPKTGNLSLPDTSADAFASLAP